jgi:hypothetical protein
VEAAASVVSQTADGTVRAQVCAGFAHIAVNIKVDRVTAYVVGILHAANTAVVLGCAAGRCHEDIAESFGNLIDDDLPLRSARPASLSRRGDGAGGGWRLRCLYS